MLYYGCVPPQGVDYQLSFGNLTIKAIKCQNRFGFEQDTLWCPIVAHKINNSKPAISSGIS